MAAAAGKPNLGSNGETERSVSELEADIRQLREDIAKLTEQLAKTGQHSYGAARRAASEGVEQLKAQGEAAIEKLRGQAHDLEDELTAHVREKPLTSLAIAAGVGYLLALLSRR
jgi:ElaB/YqjD/DUF883 family membrane-anchored ribosome-binding protein